jgi:hypothetical protein
LDPLIAVGSHFKTLAGLQSILVGTVEPKLLDLVKEYELESTLAAVESGIGKLDVRLVLVTSGVLNGPARRRVVSTNQAEGVSDYLSAVDLRSLGKLARAVAAPSAATNHLTIRSPKSEVVIVGNPGSQIAISPVSAEEIVSWPGIDDGTLFELNVRRSLKPNRVRKELDSAIRRTSDQKDFLAYHNGLTVICDKLTPRRGGFKVENASVVNGAQSTIAFKRASDDGVLTSDLRVFVKFVEVSERPQLAEGVSWRSNTQTAVNARNLVSNSGPQMRLHRDFEENYPEVFYEIKPDANLQLEPGIRRLSNDDAAQMLCSIYNAMPWLAVKRLSLFESDNHVMIFGLSISAAHVLLCDVIRMSIEAKRLEFPTLYLESWKLTRIVGMYLVGEVMRSVPELKALLDSPATALIDREELATKIDGPVRISALTLKKRAEGYVARGEADSFNKDFKNTTVLKNLGVDARSNFEIGRQFSAGGAAAP